MASTQRVVVTFLLTSLAWPWLGIIQAGPVRHFNSLNFEDNYFEEPDPESREDSEVRRENKNSDDKEIKLGIQALFVKLYSADFSILSSPTKPCPEGTKLFKNECVNTTQANGSKRESGYVPRPTQGKVTKPHPTEPGSLKNSTVIDATKATGGTPRKSTQTTAVTSTIVAKETVITSSTSCCPMAQNSFVSSTLSQNITTKDILLAASTEKQLVTSPTMEVQDPMTWDSMSTTFEGHAPKLPTEHEDDPLTSDLATVDLIAGIVQTKASTTLSIKAQNRTTLDSMQTTFEGNVQEFTMEHKDDPVTFDLTTVTTVDFFTEIAQMKAAIIASQSTDQTPLSTTTSPPDLNLASTFAIMSQSVSQSTLAVWLVLVSLLLLILVTPFILHRSRYSQYETV